MTCVFRTFVAAVPVCAAAGVCAVIGRARTSILTWIGAVIARIIVFTLRSIPVVNTCARISGTKCRTCTIIATRTYRFCIARTDFTVVTLIPGMAVAVA